MPSGVPSAILFAMLIGGALLALLPSLINRSGAGVTVDKAEQDSPVQPPHREHKARKKIDAEAHAGHESHAEPEPDRESDHHKRAAEFVDKLSRSTTMDATLQREIVAWLSTSARHREAPSVWIQQVLAAADKEPYHHKGAWLVRAIPRPRPRLIKVSSSESLAHKAAPVNLDQQRRKAA
ncbi:MAG: hypothetical protein ACRD3Q_04835 [Terriglobales bacterium]